MYYLNKIAYGLVNPLSLSLFTLALALVILLKCECKKGKLMRRVATSLAVFSFLWLLFFSLPVSTLLLGIPLEREYPQLDVSEAPEADAIVVLGGGMGSNTNACIYANMMPGADRVMAAAKLYRAAKAPIVLATGISELDSTKPFLLDLGIPEDAILIENESRNTEENAMFTQAMLLERLGSDANPRILLVTSAWHMKRSELMFRRYAPRLTIIPFAADYEATCAIDRPLEFTDFIPSVGALYGNTAYFKEHIGYWGYKIFR